MLLIAAFALFLADEVAFFPAFIMATGISSLLEILLIMYFGILTSKGYVTPAVAFAFSGAFVRAGIAVGNTWAVGTSTPPSWPSPSRPRRAWAHVRAGRAAGAAGAPGVQHRGADGRAAHEGRDRRDLLRGGQGVQPVGARGEILVLIARGYTTNNMAEKLVISPYTVNTHVRHIYEKMQIHKRSELLNYLNMQRSDF